MNLAPIIDQPSQRRRLGVEVALRDGVPNAEFSYRIVARLLHFEGRRQGPAAWADRAGGTEARTR